MQTAESYQIMLRSELVSRIAHNSKYSLRCFARQLNLSSAYVSQVLNGKRMLSIETAALIGEKLKWPENRAQRFVLLVQLARTTDVKSQAALRQKLNPAKLNFTEIQQEQINALSDWRFAAVLELTEVEGFQSCERWIARRLGITVIESSDILYQLMRAKLLEVDDLGSFRKTNQYAAMTGPQAKRAIQTYHRGALKRAERAVGDPIENREFRSLTVSTDPSRLMEFKRRIRGFEDEMTAFMEDGPRKGVFQFSIQLFRIDRDVSVTVKG